MTCYNVLVRWRKQEFVIEDSDGNIVAKLEMPFQSLPNPGCDELMEHPENQEAWERIFDLANAANN